MTKDENDEMDIILSNSSGSANRKRNQELVSQLYGGFVPPSNGSSIPANK